MNPPKGELFNFNTMISPQSPDTEQSLTLEPPPPKTPHVESTERAENPFPIVSVHPMFGQEEEEYFSFEI